MIFLLLTLIPFTADIAIALFMTKRSLNEVKVRYVIAFSSGLVVSAAFLELLPEASIESNSIFVIVGFFVFYLLEKLTLLHACGEGECEVHGIGRIMAIGMALDNLADGVGISIGYHINPLLGLFIAVAVLSHEVPQALSSILLLKREAAPFREVVIILGLAGLSYPLGGLISLIIPEELYRLILAVVAGAFLYIGAGDLMMEAHKRFNIYVIAGVLAGALLMVALSSIHP